MCSGARIQDEFISRRQSQTHDHHIDLRVTSMTPQRRLNKSISKQITGDWQREIPGLGVFASLHLLRRVGPLLVGVCLERDSSGEIYQPLFHVHFLGIEAPTVHLKLGTQLRSDRSGGPDFIEVRLHEKKYKEAAARMVRQSLLPLAGALSLDQVISAYRNYLASPIGDAYRDSVFASLYRDMSLLNAWAGRYSSAISILGESLQAGEEAQFKHMGGRAAFEAECRKRIEEPSMIRGTVESQIAALGVGSVPASDLTV